jgi:hypothetical protein
MSTMGRRVWSFPKGSSRLIERREHEDRVTLQPVKISCDEGLAGCLRIGNAREHMTLRPSADAVFFQRVAVQRDAQSGALRHAHHAATVVVEWLV